MRGYSADQLEFLRAGYLTMRVPDLTKAFNLEFQETKTTGQIKSCLKNHKFTCGRKPGHSVGTSLLFTQEQAAFVKRWYPRLSRRDLTRALNCQFDTTYRVSQVVAFVKNHGIQSGRSGRFEDGQQPWNAGSRGQGLTGPNSTSFKKGQAPKNRKPLGSERICSKEGYVLVKIAERDPYTGFPTRFKHKQVVVWEQHHGPVPEGMAVVFRDGNKLNCAPENLMLVSREELLRLNQYGYHSTPNELKPSVLALTKVEVKAFGRQKKKLARNNLSKG